MKKLLIANRGEIACRIARTARRLGLAVATVHSAADRGARHVREIGESVEVGDAPAAASYLNIDAIVAAAREVGADAVHPGYGFVSENPAFVRAVEAAGLVFVGPTAETMERLGGKARAKAEAATLAIPTVPGSPGALADPAGVAALVRTMDLPVLLKAVAGGGGRGMAVIDSPEGLEARIESAMREARQAFGDGSLIVERYLPRVRHLEVQIAGDGHGRAIHLRERECTLQRRHQKVIEEAPAAHLPERLRDAMLADAVRLAQSVGYRGLGTVEFVVSGDEYFFLEVNPRLQVEHPVTEEVTGLDLVELQLAIAATGRLPMGQSDVRCTGHAFEARVCAEDAAAGFLPATGRVSVVDFGATARVETAVEGGDAVTPFYDSMIAKLITRGPDREAARQAMVAALQGARVLGLPTNLGALADMLAWPETVEGRFHTRLIDERLDQWAGATQPDPPPAHLAAAALAWLERERRQRDGTLGCWTDWQAFTGWRLGATDTPALQPAVVLSQGQQRWPIRLSRRQPDGRFALGVADTPANARLTPLGGARHLLEIDSRSLEVTLVLDATRIEVASALGHSTLEATPFLGGTPTEARSGGTLLAPMMGKVIAIRATPGAQVTAGETVIVLESMKMELPVAAPFDGTLSRLACEVGQMVERHQVLGEVGHT
ncbi:MAG: ATP-grasp domain-containing protein [Burkholderiales bacterium]|nr:ATP-grasp domain-containing protein [Burkholderiales bacterium]